MKYSSDFYLLILSRLLLEIRNMDDDRLDEAKQLAYIFHNVPSTLQYNFDAESSATMWETIKSRAEYFELWDWIAKWEKGAFERISKI